MNPLAATVSQMMFFCLNLAANRKPPFGYVEDVFSECSIDDLTTIEGVDGLSREEVGALLEDDESARSGGCCYQWSGLVCFPSVFLFTMLFIWLMMRCYCLRVQSLCLSYAK